MRIDLTRRKKRRAPAVSSDGGWWISRLARWWFGMQKSRIRCKAAQMLPVSRSTPSPSTARARSTWRIFISEILFVVPRSGTGRQRLCKAAHNLLSIPDTNDSSSIHILLYLSMHILQWPEPDVFQPEPYVFTYGAATAVRRCFYCNTVHAQPNRRRKQTYVRISKKQEKNRASSQLLCTKKNRTSPYMCMIWKQKKTGKKKVGTPSWAFWATNRCMKYAFGNRLPWSSLWLASAQSYLLLAERFLVWQFTVGT